MSFEHETKIIEVLGYRFEGKFNLHGFNPNDLVKFAENRHGWGDSNGGFGVTYPDDLDEYDKEVEKIFIPEGYVEIYGYWGSEKGGFELIVKELDYLNQLLKVLIELKESTLAESLKRLIETKTKK